eukprot:14090888-Ditylum_brightwellii.AAC.1
MQQEEDEIELRIGGDDVEQDFQEDPTAPMPEQAPIRCNIQRHPAQKILKRIQQEDLALSMYYDVLHEDEYKQ